MYAPVKRYLGPLLVHKCTSYSTTACIALNNRPISISFEESTNLAALALSLQSESGYFKDVVVVPLTESLPLIIVKITFHSGILWLLGVKEKDLGKFKSEIIVR